MVEEIPSEKLASEHSPGPGPAVVINKSGKKRPGLAVFLVAVGVGIAALIGMALMPYVTSLPSSMFGVEQPISGGKSDAAVTTVLSDSVKATDGKGIVVEDNGLTRSAEISIADYSDSAYAPGLHCSIDSLPLYCDGTPITISGLPPGQHTFATLIHSNGGKMTETFSWNNLA